eukprot:TRINITY_DN31810_c0_g1_i1.p1 TRINITY_DN31810_c0_g1~~TRINITY_DN31810_c0_g1_i1.p1  ORF type:complete len:464 (-),score=118.91 TRINITY_DN31810_c0_g1_i1:94-1323(-)
MENFRSPNFELVADILDWLLHRFEPGCAVPDDISTEAHRLEFVKAACTKVWARTGTKMNPRKLYGADGYAVKELLRLAQLLYDAQKSVTAPGQPGDFGDDSFGLSSRVADLKNTRTLCSQIVESGAELFDLLQKETDIKPDRERALQFLDGMSRNLDSTGEAEAVERSVNQLLSSHGQNLEQLRTTAEELQRDEKGLEQKIKKKRQELDRCKKRLASLVNVRPAFMDEYEQLEQELERYYEQYVGRFRNLDYLEHEIDKLNREEKERMEENDRALKRMQKRLREEEWRLLRGEEDDKEGKRKPPKAKNWTPGGDAGHITDDDEDVSSAASGSESNPAISVAGSQDSQDEIIGRGLRGEAPVSIGGSASDDDILNESEDGGDISDDDDRGYWGGGGGPPRKMGGNNDFDF